MRLRLSSNTPTWMKRLVASSCAPIHVAAAPDHELGEIRGTRHDAEICLTSPDYWYPPKPLWGKTNVGLPARTPGRGDDPPGGSRFARRSAPAMTELASARRPTASRR